MSKNFKDLGIGAIAGILAGAYYLYGSSDGAAKRKQLKGWGLKMQGEVMEKLEKLKEITEPKFNEVVDLVSNKYKHIEKKQVGELVADMKKTWKKMQREVKEEVLKRQAQIQKENQKLVKVSSNAKSTLKKKAGEVNKKVAATKKKVIAPKVKNPTSQAVKTEVVQNTAEKPEMNNPQN